MYGCRHVDFSLPLHASQPRCPTTGKQKPFKDYIHLERQLGEVDRCRTLYTKYLEMIPTNCSAWVRFAELESSLDEVARARAVYEVAVSQPMLDMPEMLWKKYIDFEIHQATEGEGKDEDAEMDEGGTGAAAASASASGQRVRELYERLLDRTKHVKVWISYATFEANSAVGGGAADARSIFRKAYGVLKEQELKEERVVLLEAWRDIEKGLPRDQQDIEEVTKMMPRKLKKRRLVIGDDGEEQGWEEYYDYQFPDDRAAPMNLKILEMAHKWKQGGGVGGGSGGGAGGALGDAGDQSRKRKAEDEAEVELDDE